MTTYLHHTPGRLRIRSPMLKRNPAAAADAARLVGSQEGVLSCTVNTVTGSMLILYEQAGIESDSLSQLLVEHGYMEWPATVSGANQLLEEALSSAGEFVIKAMAMAVLEQVARRSALALMGAIR